MEMALKREWKGMRGNVRPLYPCLPYHRPQPNTSPIRLPLIIISSRNRQLTGSMRSRAGLRKTSKDLVRFIMGPKASIMALVASLSSIQLVVPLVYYISYMHAMLCYANDTTSHRILSHRVSSFTITSLPVVLHISNTAIKIN